MKDIKKTKRAFVWTFRIMAFLLILLFSSPFWLFLLHESTLLMSPKAWSDISSGMSREKVIELLGIPKKECAEYMPSTCYIRGYGKPKDTKATRTMIYLSADKVLFIFLDKHGIVTETYHAGS